LTYVIGNTYPEEGDSYWNTNLGCRSTLDQMEECYCRTSAIRIQAVHCWRVRSEKESSVRSKMMQSYRTNANYRSEPTNQGIQENQPGVTKCRMRMPVAAVAKAEKAAYHSHTAVVEERDD
jgi:hypothetical protein